MGRNILLFQALIETSTICIAYAMTKTPAFPNAGWNEFLHRESEINSVMKTFVRLTLSNEEFPFGAVASDSCVYTLATEKLRASGISFLKEPTWQLTASSSSFY